MEKEIKFLHDASKSVFVMATELSTKRDRVISNVRHLKPVM
jgi:hypothetical protein